VSVVLIVAKRVLLLAEEPKVANIPLEKNVLSAAKLKILNAVSV
jgi:hypothetical protein